MTFLMAKMTVFDGNMTVLRKNEAEKKKKKVRHTVLNMKMAF
jgi:hypothetical protein